MYWVLDVMFNEDSNRTRKEYSSENISNHTNMCENLTMIEFISEFLWDIRL